MDHDRAKEMRHAKGTHDCMCEGKKAFYTEPAARRFGKQFDQRPYHCVYCRKWHLTRDEGKKWNRYG